MAPLAAEGAHRGVFVSTHRWTRLSVWPRVLLQLLPGPRLTLLSDLAGPEKRALRADEGGAAQSSGSGSNDGPPPKLRTRAERSTPESMLRTGITHDGQGWTTA